MYKNKILILFLFFYSCLIFSQGEANNWYFGNNAAITFNNGSPEAVTGSQVSTREGVCSISDKDGNLLFYSDGITVWNKNNNVMTNGSNLLGDPSSTQSGVAIPYPGNDNLYYLITVDDWTGNNGIRYNLIDMTANGGLGAVTSKNQLLQSSTSEKLTAVKHTNGTDIWIIAHEKANNNYMSYLVTSSGINTTPVVSSIGHVFESQGGRDDSGYLKVSPNGKKVISALFKRAELFDFDASTGVLSNPINLNLSGNFSPYGAEFSTSLKYVYLSALEGASSKIFRYDISSNNANTINNSKLEIDLPSSCPDLILGGIQLAPDGKIYFSQFQSTAVGYNYLGVIENPNDNNPTYNCNAVLLDPGLSELGLPTFIQSFFLNTLTAENFCLGETTQFNVNPTGVINSILWDFGDGNSSTAMNPSHTYMNAGIYNVTATITSGGTTTNEEIEVTIYETPIFHTTTSYEIEDDPFDGVADFDLTTKDNEILNGQSTSDFEVLYYLTEDDAENNVRPLSSPYTNTSNPQTIYSRVHNINNTSCFQTGAFELIVTSPTNIGNITDYITCSLTPNTATFDLNSKNTEALDGKNPADYNITYHLTQNEANNNSNPLNSPYPYTNTSSALTVYARLEMVSDPSQFATTSFNLIVSQAPTVTKPEDINLCDDATNDGVESFNFTNAITEVLNGQDPNIFTVTLFSSQDDLDNNRDPLSNGYQNTLASEEIFVKIENSTNANCVEQTSFNISVSSLPIANKPNDAILCKDPSVNNTVTINLEDYITEILGTQTPSDFTITFHENSNNAINNIAPISNMFSTTNSNEEVFFRIESNTNSNCFATTSLNIIVNNSAAIGTLGDVNLCDNDGDGIINFNLSTKNSEALSGLNPSDFEVLYFASQDDLERNENELPINYQNILAEEQVFVRIHPLNNKDCYNQASFFLRVTPTPTIANTLQNLNECGIMGEATFNLSDNNTNILGNQNATELTITYHNSSDDANNNIRPINNPQDYTSNQNGEEIFVRIENNNNTACFATDSFTLNIFESPIANNVTDIEICDENNDVISFDLNTIIRDILGTQDPNLFNITFYDSPTNADDKTNPISANLETTETNTIIYARIENVNNSACYQTTSFNVIKRKSPELNIDDQIICAGEIATVIADTGYDTYLWSTGETSESINITTPGIYTVTATKDYININCSTTKEFIISHAPVPQNINVTINDFNPIHGNSIRIIAEGDGDFEYSLDGINYQENNLFTNLDPGDYIAYVRGKAKCTTLSKQIYILSYPLFFTPNGDGINETWQIINADKEPNNVIYIMNRFGKILANFKQSDKGWDGTYNNKQMPSSDYWFKLQRTNGQVIQGHFSLRR